MSRTAKQYEAQCGECGAAMTVKKKHRETYCNAVCRSKGNWRRKRAQRLLARLADNVSVDVRTVKPGAAFPDGRIAEEPGGLFVAVSFTPAGWGMVAEAAAQLGRDPEDYVLELQREAIANVHLALNMSLPEAL